MFSNLSDIAQGDLNQLMNVYIDLLPQLDGYLIVEGKPVFRRLEKVCFLFFLFLFSYQSYLPHRI